MASAACTPRASSRKAKPGLPSADLLKIFRPVHIRKLARIGLDGDGTELGEGVREPELVLLEASLEHRQGDAGDGRREWASSRDRRLVARIAEGADELRSYEWDIDRKEDRDRVGRRAEAGDDPGERGSEVGSVVEHRERELERVRLLADGDPLVAALAEDPPRALGQGLAVEPGEGLGRAEAGTCAADEQDAGQASTRHRSV